MKLADCKGREIFCDVKSSGMCETGGPHKKKEDANLLAFICLLRNTIGFGKVKGSDQTQFHASKCCNAVHGCHIPLKKTITI